MSYALIVSWIVAVLFALLLGVAILARPNATASDKPSVPLARFRRFLVAAMRFRWLTLGITLASFAAGERWVGAVAAWGRAVETADNWLRQWPSATLALLFIAMALAALVASR